MKVDKMRELEGDSAFEIPRLEYKQHFLFIFLATSTSTSIYTNTMANEAQEQAFKDLLAEIESKRWTPLMNSDDIQEANNLVSKAAQSQTTIMTTASTLFIVPKSLRTRQHKQQFIKTKVDFHTARYNNITASDIRDLIPTYIQPHDKVYLKRKRFIESRSNSHVTQSLHWLYRAVKKIAKSTDACINRCGWETKDFFKELTDEQRMEVLGAVFDQYPLWLVTQLCEREAKSVDFKQIWSLIDSPDRVALRSYYRLLFVGMADATYQIHFLGALGGDTKELKKAWQEFPSCAAVKELKLEWKVAWTQNKNGNGLIEISAVRGKEGKIYYSTLRV
ncbi:hypothetical protein N431DRAFT_467513 [Stipitochalara longipes BDJ]|nr:hypothetical protein N431DRAFT_467513 [Stipitochalara longipes BDJ]